MAWESSRQLQITDNVNSLNFSNSFNVATNHITVNTRADDETREILQWLSPLEPQQRHQGVRNSRLDGVGSWLLETNEFRRWSNIDMESSDIQPVLFCYGNPGVGKTYLTSLVIDNLVDMVGEKDIAVAGLYCDFFAHQQQSCANMLGAIAKQLVNRGEVPDHVRQDYRKAEKTFGGQGLRIPDLVEMLKRIIASLDHVFICIDALDESVTDDRLKLLGSLKDVIREAPNTRLFITGRPPIKDEVEQRFPKAVMIPISPKIKDIQEYLEMRLENDPTPKAMNDDLRAEIMKTIPETISTIFLLVSLNIDAILEQVTIHQRRKKLQEMTTGNGLGDAYTASIARIKSQKGNKSRLGMDVLMWVSHSERPLKATELCHALGVERGSTDLNIENIPAIETLLECSLGLVTVEESSSTVRLIHLTLREYLSSDPALFHTPHSMIAEICLTYLDFRSIRDLPITLKSTLWPTTTSFLAYASYYWGVHAKKEPTQSVIPLALRLLDGFENHISSLLLFDKLNGWAMYPGLNYDTPAGFTGLHGAAYFGLEEIIVAFLEIGSCDINATDYMECTAILYAAIGGHDKVVKALLGRSGISPDVPDWTGVTALMRAAKNGHEGVVRMLLERDDVDPNTVDTEYGKTALMRAAKNGHEGVVGMLLERDDIDPNTVDTGCGQPGDGRTALMRAAKNGHEGVVSMLLEQDDIDVNTEDYRYRTAFTLAVGNGHEGVVRMLLERDDVDPNTVDTENGQTALMWAAENGHEGVVRMLLERDGIDPNTVNTEYGQTALTLAAGNGHEGIVRMLLERDDVDPNTVDTEYGQTALTLAAGNGHEGVVRMLLERDDIDPNTVDTENGQTALMWAAEYEHEGVVRMLLERDDVDPNTVDTEYGQTALMLAAENGYEGVVKLLLECDDVNMNKTDRAGETALSHALRNKHRGVVGLLLKRKKLVTNSIDAEGAAKLPSATLLESP